MRPVTELQRRLGVPTATAVGVAAMLGAGIFFVWAPAARAAGAGLLIGLAIAALVATLNALSTTQLAMAHPVSGGAYSYGRAELSPTAGFAAGALFLFGKTASVAAIALVAGAYLAPGLRTLGGRRPRARAVARECQRHPEHRGGQLRDRGARRGRHRRDARRRGLADRGARTLGGRPGDRSGSCRRRA